MNLTVRTAFALLGVALVALLVLVNFPILGIAGFAALGALIASGAKWGKDRKQSLILSEHLSAESRLLLRPIRRLAAFNREIVRKHESHFSVTDEALVETENVVRQCIRWLEVRDRLETMLKGKRAAHIQLAHLKWRLETAFSEDERASLTRAIVEQQQQVDHYLKVQHQVDVIDMRIKHAQFALEHLKMVLTMTSIDAQPSDDNARALGIGGSGMAAGG